MDSNNDTTTTTTEDRTANSATNGIQEHQNQQQTTQQRTIVDGVKEHVVQYPKRALALTGGAVAPFLTWVSVSFLGGSITAPGIDHWVGKIYLLLVIGLAAVEFGSDIAPKIGVSIKEAWVYGGLGMILLSAGFAVYTTIRISQMNSDLGLFSGAVDASLGFGVFLAIGAGLLATYLGTQMAGTVRGYTVE